MVNMSPRVSHDHEEAKRPNPEAMRAKRREQYHASIDKLIEAGVYTPLKPGRKRLYSPEEALEVAKKQRKESYMRRQERLNASRAMLVQE